MLNSTKVTHILITQWSRLDLANIGNIPWISQCQVVMKDAFWRRKMTQASTVEGSTPYRRAAPFSWATKSFVLYSMRILWHGQNSYHRNAKISVDNADSVSFNFYLAPIVRDIWCCYIQNFMRKIAVTYGWCFWLRDEHCHIGRPSSSWSSVCIKDIMIILLVLRILAYCIEGFDFFELLMVVTTWYAGDAANIVFN